MHLDPIKHPIKIHEMYKQRLIIRSAYALFMTLFSVLDKLRYQKRLQISNKELAKKAVMCQKTLRRAKLELQRAGLIAFWPGTGHNETTYVINDILRKKKTMAELEGEAEYAP